jgi:hypothetical protein
MAALWQHWGALVALAEMRQKLKSTRRLLFKSIEDNNDFYRNSRRLESQRVWDTWCALAAYAIVDRRVDAYEASLSEEWRRCRRLESQLTWQAWQGLVAMAMVQRRNQWRRDYEDLALAIGYAENVWGHGVICAEHHLVRSGVTELHFDRVRMFDADAGLRRLESLRTWQAWAGVLAMAAACDQWRSDGIGRQKLKPIHTEEEHAAAMHEADALLEKVPEEGTVEYDRLEMLGILLSAYEQEHPDHRIAELKAAEKRVWNHIVNSMYEMAKLTKTEKMK